MEMVAHDPGAAKKTGVPVKVAKEFVMADIGRKFGPAKPAKPMGRKSK
jgi:hypothetical protein